MPNSASKSPGASRGFLMRGFGVCAGFGVGDSRELKVRFTAEDAEGAEQDKACRQDGEDKISKAGAARLILPILSSCLRLSWFSLSCSASSVISAVSFSFFIFTSVVSNQNSDLTRFRR